MGKNFTKMSQRKHSQIANLDYGLGCTMRKFTDKTVTEGSNTVKLFTHEIFWLYGNTRCVGLTIHDCIIHQIHVHVHCTYYGYTSLRSLRKVGVRYLDCP